VVDSKGIGIMARRRTKKPPPAEEAPAADLGRPPKEPEFALRAGEVSERLKECEAVETHLEGVLAAAEVRVNGHRVVLSRIRTQEHVGLLLAEATREQMDAEAHYRAWRARLGLGIVTNAKKEVPEWRVRQLIESEPNYLTYQQGLARAAANVLALKAVWETWGDE
jgi:hypothetical protein